MKNVLLSVLFFVGGYSTSQYFFSKYTDVDSLTHFAKDSFYLGCLITVKNYNSINTETKNFCQKKSFEHKKSLDMFLGFVL